MRSRPMAAFKAARNARVDSVGGECGGADDHFARALFYERACARRSAHAAAGADCGLGCEKTHQGVVRSTAHGGVEVDYLNFGEGGELVQHRLGRILFKRFFAALHQLHCLAIH